MSNPDEFDRPSPVDFNYADDEGPDFEEERTYLVSLTPGRLPGLGSPAIWELAETLTELGTQPVVVVLFIGLEVNEVSYVGPTRAWMNPKTFQVRPANVWRADVLAATYIMGLAS